MVRCTKGNGGALNHLSALMVYVVLVYQCDEPASFLLPQPLRSYYIFYASHFSLYTPTISVFVECVTAANVLRLAIDKEEEQEEKEEREGERA